jgi:hypothetical protein
MEGQLFSLTLTELRDLVYELAEKIILSIISMRQRCLENVGCIRALRETLKLDTLEPTSLARVIDFNGTVVNTFFDLFSGLYDQYNFSPDRCAVAWAALDLNQLHHPILAYVSPSPLSPLPSDPNGPLAEARCT